MLALFSAAPPQATQTLFRLSLCRHAYTACELRTSASILLLFVEGTPLPEAKLTFVILL